MPLLKKELQDEPPSLFCLEIHNMFLHHKIIYSLLIQPGLNNHYQLESFIFTHTSTKSHTMQVNQIIKQNTFQDSSKSVLE